MIRESLDYPCLIIRSEITKSAIDKSHSLLIAIELGEI